MLDDDTPGFGVEFLIDAGESFSELAQLASVMESTEAKVLAEARRIEKATSSMVDLAAATSSITAFATSATRDLGQVGKTKEALDRILGRAITITTSAPALTREAAASAREINKTEKEIEKLVRAIDRETAATGRSREEQRQARIEELAITAARQGNTDAADRLQAAVRRLGQAREAVAQDNYAATIAAETAAIEAQNRIQAAALEQLRERARLEAALERTNGADRPRATSAGATFSALAEREAAAEAAFMRYAANGPVLFEAAARKATQAARELVEAEEAAARESERLAAAGQRLRASIDPAFAAQQRFNREMGEAKTLIGAGTISLDDYCTKLRIEQAALDESARAHGRAGAGASANRAAMQGLSFQAQDAFTQLSMGANILNVLAIQGGQAAGQMANMGGKLGAVASFLVGPWGLAITGAMLVLGALTDGLFSNEDAANKAAEGMKKFQDRQSDIGNFIDATTGKLNEQNRTLVLNAILTRQAQLADNNKAITEGRNAAFAKATIAGRGGRAAAVGNALGDGNDIVSRASDPDVQRAIAAAGGNVDKLASSIARLAQTTRPDLKKLALDISTQAGAAILATRENAKLGKELRALSGDTTALATGSSALIEKQVALTTATTPLARARAQLALVQQGGAAADKAGGAALVKYRNDLTAATNAVNAADAAEKAATASRRESTKAANHAAAEARKAQNHAEDLAREAEAMEAQTKNLRALAVAWEQASGAALIAEANVTAESKAIRARGDVDAFVARQIALVIAQRVSDAAKSTAAMRQEAAIQAEVNGLVAAGLVPAERANELVRERMADLPLLAAIEAAEQKGLTEEVKRATAALKAQQDVRESKKAADTGTYFAIAEKQAERQLALQQEELKLIGATDMERVRAMATIQAEQKLEADGQSATSAFGKKFIDDQVKIATGAETNRQAQEAYNASLTATGDLFDTIDQSAQSAAGGIADAFGRVGSAVGDALTIVTGFYADQARLQEQHAAAISKAGTDEVRIARENRLFAIRSSSMQINAYGNMVSAAKGFFKEGSAGYKAMAAAEKVYRVAQLAMSVASIIQNGAETVSAVANSATRATANAAEGISAQAKLPFPANIAAMAATGAALVAAGIAVFGGGGGGAAASVKSAEDYQKGQGTGSILGDASAKSESIGKSLDLMMKNSNRDLEYSSEMARSLRAIESGIGNLAAAVARETKVGGGLDASALGLGTNTSGGLLGVGGLFSKKITRELNDAGLQFDGASVASVIAGGITANLYQEVLKTTKKSGFLGIGGSTKTTVETIRTGADAGLTSEVSLLVANMRTAIVGAAGTIGIDGAAAMLDAFQINIGRISFKDLTSEEIEAELAAVFSRVGDDMAGAIGGDVAAFQRAGEGMLETLMRLAKEYTTVDVALRSIGMTFGAVGLASVGARTSLVELFGSLDEFTEATSFFRENFLSEAEQMAPVITAVRGEMDRLGLSGVTTKTAFKDVVLGLDLSTASGREVYAALMAVAPAFAKTTDYLASLGGELENTALTAEQLAAIAKQRRALEIQLMEASGDAAGALAAKRADEVAALDETLRALQQQIYVAQDAAQAARDLAAAEAEVTRAATALATQRRGLEIELMEATGDATGALAARRADEIAALDATLRPIREAILAAQDAAAAQTALAASQAEAAQTALALAQTRRGLEIELMEALGDAAGALAAKRADELAGTDATLRALREQIYAAQDAAAANAALAQAQQDAASAAASAAAQVAAAVAQIASQRSSLEIQLMRAQGNEAGAVSAERDLQLAATDESLRGLQQQVWAAEDARKAAEEAARAQVEYAQQMQQAAQAAQQAAQDAEQLRRQRAGMDAQLLELLGNSAGALALRRQEELAALDASLRPLQQSIYAQEDLAAAATAAADRVDDARGVLTDAYKRESDALRATIDTMGGLGDGLRKFRSELGAGSDAVGDAYLTTLGRFNVLDAKAARGDAGALAELEAAGKDFLTAARDRAGSLADYQRDVARVAAAVDRGIGATDEAVDYAQAQLDALKSSVTGLIDVNESVVSVRDAIAALAAEIAGRPASKLPDPPATVANGAAKPVQVDTSELERRVDENAKRTDALAITQLETLGKIQRRLDGWDGGGLLIRTDDDTPVAVKTVGGKPIETKEVAA